MGQKRLSVILVLALVGVVYLAGSFVTSTARVPVPPLASAFRASVTAAAQDLSAVEAALGLDRPTRRMIQQGLRNEGFDPGAPDGLFGPRTRAAIQAWQAARDEPRTGYLDGDEVAALLAAVPRPVTASPEPHGPAPVSAPAAHAPARVAVPDAELSTSATDARSSATPDTPAPLVVESSGVPTPASRPGELPPEILIDRPLVAVPEREELSGLIGWRRRSRPVPRRTAGL